MHNGIDTADWEPVSNPDRVRELGVDPDRPSVVFVGRITRQKGLPLFLRAVAQLPPDVQIVLCAGAPDTPEIQAEVEELVASLAASRDGVVWIREMLPRADVVALLTAATAFACPSIYEPLGIVNLEAMACETAVVATATGGIPEVVVPGETGLLVPIEQATDGTGTPLDPEQYVADFAAALTEVVADPARAAAMGKAGRERAIDGVQLAGDRREDGRGLPLGVLTGACDGPVDSRSRDRPIAVQGGRHDDDETFRPIIHTQADLEDAWRTLMEPLGFSRRSLWLMFIDTDDRPLPQVTEIEDIPPVLDDEDRLGLQRLLAHFGGTGLRPAFLISRPGAGRPDRRRTGACAGAGRRGLPRRPVSPPRSCTWRPTPTWCPSRWMTCRCRRRA